MIIYLTEDAEICGDDWKKGTRLSAPDKAAREAIERGVASTEAPAAAKKKATPAKKKATPAPDPEPEKTEAPADPGE